MPNRSSSALGFSGYESPTESNYNGWPPTDGEVSFPASPAITRSNTPRPDYHPHHPQTQNRHVQVQLHHPQPQRPRFSRLSTANTVITTAGLIEGGNGNGGFRPASLDEAATGGVANVLYSIPYRSKWLTGIGLAFFFLNIILYLINCLMLSLRFWFRPGAFLNSLTDQVESLFISAIIVSAGTILITICQYGVPHVGPWLLRVMEILFWVYVGVSFVVSAALYLTLWSTQIFPIHTMTPVWVFPAYPLLLTAPFAANLISAAVRVAERDGRVGSALGMIDTIAVATAAVAVQGTGFLIAFMICAAFLYRLMTQKLPRDHQRPGVFISIGPSGFTAAGLVSLGNLTPAIFPSPTSSPTTPESIFSATTPVTLPMIARLFSLLAGLWLWGLSVWFFLVSIGSLVKYLRREHRAKLRFQMTWFSFVFPNTALVTATEALGIAFDSAGLKIFGCVLAALIILVWMIVFGKMVVCLWRRELLWPKDDD
ncbi:uncharacterized protein CTHT_0006700 [Thermochaetoides thermophila DSM 1495]|uniref:Malic acid transport protein n=1 Tax=Chaetomium thermophilum (strain DSM 1495 / CBS 144.50 / IMI 039719) TaxID=759272 RepID=G0RYH4_CHATD|nr:hypothetical protein CTHT_0006700 [Thermochaetoides thermophila DSM 1495]EGS23960.1 hypothetical protein CTHT_0006700 [Thermochaetoides thermophila DSM 1495]